MELIKDQIISEYWDSGTYMAMAYWTNTEFIYNVPDYIRRLSRHMDNAIVHYLDRLYAKMVTEYEELEVLD